MYGKLRSFNMQPFIINSLLNIYEKNNQLIIGILLLVFLCIIFNTKESFADCIKVCETASAKCCKEVHGTDAKPLVPKLEDGRLSFYREGSSNPIKFKGTEDTEISLTPKTGDVLPIGTIIPWYPFKLAPKPDSKKWALCDGTNGTPDLINKFIKGGDKSFEQTLKIGMGELP